jgi:hypothetical protein
VTPINQARPLQFPWNRKGAAREHVLDFLALAEAQAPYVGTGVDTAAARRTLAWLRRLADMQRDDPAMVYPP